MARVSAAVMAEPDPPSPARPLPEIPIMTVRIANSILTHAPLTELQLECARLYYRNLAELLIQGGPRFHHARRDAIDMHNRVVRWIKGAREEEIRRKTIVEEETLLEINP